MFIIKVKNLYSWKDKSIGLLNVKKAFPIFFKTRFGIHTLGMKFSIDVLILDRNNSIIKLKENLKPNQIFIWNPKFDKVIELPEGYIKRNNLKLNQKLEVTFI